MADAKYVRLAELLRRLCEERGWNAKNLYAQLGELTSQGVIPLSFSLEQVNNYYNVGKTETDRQKAWPDEFTLAVGILFPELATIFGGSQIEALPDDYKSRPESNGLALWIQFFAKQGGGRIVLRGVAGQGKSTLAVSIMRSQSRQFAGVLVVHVATAIENVSATIAHWAQSVGLPGNSTREEIEQVLKERDQRWLIVLDDAPGPGSCHPFLIGTNHVYVITTRNRMENVDWKGDGNQLKVMDLRGLRLEQGLSLLWVRLQTEVTPAEREIAKLIVELVQGNPLALKAARNLIQQNGVTRTWDQLKDKSLLHEKVPRAMRQQLQNETEMTVVAVLRESLDVLQPEAQIGFISLWTFAEKPGTFEAADVYDFWRRIGDQDPSNSLKQALSRDANMWFRMLLTSGLVELAISYGIATEEPTEAHEQDVEHWYWIHMLNRQLAQYLSESGFVPG